VSTERPSHEHRAASFVEEWVRENAVKPVEGAPAGDDSEARLRAEACLAAAKEEGIAREDIEEETGDLVAYMGAVIANLVNHPEHGSPTTDDNREQLIRTKAFYIWLDEGCPEGRADAHWQMATELVATEEGRFDLAPQPSTNPTAPKAAQTRKPSK
jgi:Protein of unknown function (DUF2934)